MVRCSARNGRNSERSRTQDARIRTTASLERTTPASVMPCRNKLAKGCPNRDGASAIRITGVRRAMRPAQRCRQCVRDGQCRRVDVVRILDTTQIVALRRIRASTALKTRVEPCHRDGITQFGSDSWSPLRRLRSCIQCRISSREPGPHATPSIVAPRAARSGSSRVPRQATRASPRAAD
jgi:hypothetical protein